MKITRQDILDFTCVDSTSICSGLVSAIILPIILPGSGPYLISVIGIFICTQLIFFSVNLVFRAWFKLLDYFKKS